jgi:hypothetical protein
MCVVILYYPVRKKCKRKPQADTIKQLLVEACGFHLCFIRYTEKEVEDVTLRFFPQIPFTSSSSCSDIVIVISQCFTKIYKAQAVYAL